MDPPIPMSPQSTENNQTRNEITITEMQLNTGENQREFRLKIGDRPSIHVTVTPSATVVDQWITQTVNYDMQKLVGRLLVGLGVRWFENNHNADTLQLCVGDRCLIFQLTRADAVPLNFRSFLMDKRINFVGIHNSEHKQKLLHSRHRLEISNRVFDLRFHAKDNNGNSLQYTPAGMIKQQYLSLRANVVSLKDHHRIWSAVNLTLKQIKFACIDAYAPYRLGMCVAASEFEVDG
ncbi:unnamed protein product [Dovyalis caffra]|uniref:Uncharacterized protein n=1 Tax=Dovyalis caffra TaxID=77055 RepID=A0AAV1QQ77_9ROSI|nr:unnamed protein product [Dovyalis caffra]